MDKQLKEQKLVNLANDPVMMEALHEIFLFTFSKKRGGDDIYSKGSRWIAFTELLPEAWQIVESYRLDNKKEGKASVNPGL